MESSKSRGRRESPGGPPIAAVRHRSTPDCESTRPNWNIKKFVRTARRYRTIQIKAGRQTLTAADPLPDDLRDVLTKINSHDVPIIWPTSGPRFMRCPLC